MRKLIGWFSGLTFEQSIAVLLIAALALLLVTSSGCCASLETRRASAERLLESQAILRRAMVPDLNYTVEQAEQVDCGDEVCRLERLCLAHQQEDALRRLAEEEGR